MADAQQYCSFFVDDLMFGIAVRKRDGSAVGIGRLVLRDLAHLLDTAALFVGWLRAAESSTRAWEETLSSTRDVRAAEVVV